MAKMMIATTIAGTLRSFLLPFASHFRSKGWTVDGMAMGISQCEQCKSHFDNVWEIDWSRNPFSIHQLIRTPRQIRQIVDTLHLDLIHVHTPVAAFLTRFALRKRRGGVCPRIIYTAHGFHFFRGGNPLTNLFFLICEKMAGYWTDYLVVMNEEDLAVARQFSIVPDNRLRYMPGIGVDLKKLAAVSPPLPDKIRKLREEMDLPENARLFLMVAEFIPRKRHVDAVHALALLARPDVHLAFAGRGPTTQRVKRLANRLGLDKRVHFLGFRADLPELMRIAEAILLPSLQEGLPRSLMEAMCLKVPCIGSDIRGTRDLLEHGCGLLFTVRDHQQLSDAMRMVLDDSAAARQMAERARMRMVSHDIERVIHLHEELYEEATSV